MHLREFDTHVPGDGRRLHPPRRIRRLIERLDARDKAWFARHPGQPRFVRPVVAGELWPEPHGPDTLVLVTQVSPGTRARQALDHLASGDGRTVDILDPSGHGVLFRAVPLVGVRR